MSLKSTWPRIKHAFALAVVVGTVGAVANFGGCGTSHTTTTSYATVDPYLYTVYYPADVAYSTVYWTDSWAYPTLYASSPTPVVTSMGANGMTTIDGSGVIGVGSDSGTEPPHDSGVPADAAAPTTSALTTPGDAIRALARGESVCPGHITVTPKMAAPPCTGGPSSVRAGVTIAFDGCATDGGGTLSGMVDVTSTRTANSTACSSTTMISLSHSTTISNLRFTGPSGRQLLIPSHTGTGSSTYNFGTTPATMALTFQGQLQTFATGGTLGSDQNYTANLTFSFGGSTTQYTVDGNVMIIDNRAAGAGSTITVTGLTRTTTCCRPVGGTINIMHTSGTGGIGSHVVGFGPSCGEATLDGTSSMLPACI
jgi:hypothetical protein